MTQKNRAGRGEVYNCIFDEEKGEYNIKYPHIHKVVYYDKPDCGYMPMFGNDKCKATGGKQLICASDFDKVCGHCAFGKKYVCAVIDTPIGYKKIYGDKKDFTNTKP